MHAPLYDEDGLLPTAGQAFFVTAGDGFRIRFAVWNQGQGKTALIYPGRTEYIEKHHDTVGRLLKRGYDCVVLDWRGQGLSDRSVKDPAMGHVLDFRDYQLDLKAVLAHPAVAAMSPPALLLAHSMGGLIGLRSLADRVIAPAHGVFSAPMWGIRAHPLKSTALLALAVASDTVGRGQAGVPVGSKEPYILVQPFEGNLLTSDPAAYAETKALHDRHPEIGLAKPTLKWLREAAREMARLRRIAAPIARALVLLGEDEQIVDSKAIRRQCARHPKWRLKTFADARHELLMERAELRNAVWREIDAYLSGD